METAADILKQIPPLLDKASAGPDTFVVLETGLVSSLDTVLSQEIDKFNCLLERIKASLISLDKAIRGLIVMSLDLDKMYMSFLINQVGASSMLFLL